MQLNDLRDLFSDSIKTVSRSYSANEFVFQKGNAVEGLFGVEEGCVKLERYTVDGTAARIHQANVRECFGEAALFSSKYDCNALTTKLTRLVLFPKNEVLVRLRDDPKLAIKYVALLSIQVKNLRTSLELRGIPSARERILNYLQLTVNQESETLVLDTTIKDLSERLGLAHETMYRELKKLEKESVIERFENRIKLLHSI